MCHPGSGHYVRVAAVVIKIVVLVVQNRFQSWVLARLYGQCGRSHMILREGGAPAVKGEVRRTDQHSEGSVMVGLQEKRMR